MSKFVVRPMRIEDVESVSEVERECFTTPWPTSAYRRELRDNRMGRYLVLVEIDENTATDTAVVGAVRPTERPTSSMRRAIDQIFRPFTNGSAGQRSSTEQIVGFAGMWLMLDEAHITTIGVKRSLRGQGLGEVLFVRLLEIAIEMGALRSTLEVRVSNRPAQALYEKYGFTREGVRKRYYSDDNEDAYIMWSDRLESPEFRERFSRLKHALQERLGDTVDVRDC